MSSRMLMLSSPPPVGVFSWRLGRHHAGTARREEAWRRDPAAVTSRRGSVAAAVDQRALLDPRHHGAQLLADLLDRMRRHLGAHGLERGLIDAVLQHPVFDELARLDVVEDLLHLG